MRRVLVIGLLLLVATSASAQSPFNRLRLGYSVQQGVALSCADATVRCVPSEYATIKAACDASNAGDVDLITAGTYAAVAACTHNGTAGNPITILANGAVSVCSLAFSGNSYISIVGLTVDGAASGCSGSANLVTGSGTNTGLEFWNLVVTNTTGHGYYFDFPANGSRCDACIAFGGAVTNIGNPSSSHGFAMEGNDLYIGYVSLSNICYIGIRPSGSRSRYIHNDFSGFVQCGASHPDFFYVHGTSSLGYTDGLIEAMFATGTPTANDNKVYHAQNDGTQNWNNDVLRLSVVYNTGSASSHSIYTTSTGAINRWRQYHNTHVLGDRAVSAGNGTTCGGGTQGAGAISVYFYNNIYDACWSDDNSASLAPLGANWTWTAADYNLAYDPDGTVTFLANWTNQAHEQSNVNPSLVNVGTDFTLQSGSGARGAGGPLTTATSCSGTTLNVASNTGSFFIGNNAANLAAYGGLLVPGDVLTVGASTTRTVVSVSGDAITVDSSLTCSASDPVYFGASSTIDIGAYPYKAGGYTLSGTYHQAGSTVTVTPNDATLARFAVIYENLIPKCVADASNAWACTVGAGVVTVSLYPRYASQTQSVTATIQ